LKKVLRKGNIAFLWEFVLFSELYIPNTKRITPMEKPVTPFLHYLTDTLRANKTKIKDDAQLQSLLTMLVELQESARVNNDKDSALHISAALKDVGVTLNERRHFSLTLPE